MTMKKGERAIIATGLPELWRPGFKKLKLLPDAVLTAAAPPLCLTVELLSFEAERMDWDMEKEEKIATAEAWNFFFLLLIF